ncbi:MAG: hypothetical protein JSV88_33970 [Candidatus Aminicenantes bacterium]|nr:MAG: hypothetical protein JSV88_33970 [Candidatus Aminicenantes bacterium]
MSFKFPAHQRLSKEEDFKNLIKKSKKIRNRFFFFTFYKMDIPITGSLSR